MNNAFSSNFDVVCDRLLYFWEDMVCLGIFQKTKYIFLALGMWDCSSEGYFSKDFRCLKD